MDGESHASSRIQIGDLTLETGTHRLLRGQQQIDLPQLSYHLLLTLVEAAPNLVTHDELAEKVWPGRIVSPETMTQRIRLLRQSLGDDAQKPRYIGLVRGEGYRIIAKVRRDVPSREKRRSIRTYAAAGILIALAVGFYSGSFQFGDNASYNSIAVMPFMNASQNTADIYISEGLGDELRDQLGRIGGLRVVARSSSVALRDSEASAMEVANSLGVDLLVEGAMRREDDHLRITVQIIDGKSGFQVWSQSFDRVASDLLEIQKEIALEVSQHLLPSLDAEIAARMMQTQIVSANDLLILARFNQLQATETHLIDVPTLLKAIAFYRDAIVLDPDSAIAHARLGSSLLQLGDAANAKEPIFRALSLDSELSEVQYTLGLYYWLRELPGSGAAYQRAIALNPSNTDALAAYGHWIWHQEQVSAAEAYFREALEIDPLSLTRYADLGTYYGIIGRRDDALRIAAQIEKRFRGAAGLMVLARIYETAGDFDTAIDRALQAHDLQPDEPDPQGMVAELYARIGDFNSAQQYEPIPGIGQLYFQRRYAELIELAEERIIDYPNEIQIWYSLARAYNSTGQFANTVRLLERAGLPERVFTDSVRANGKEALATLADAYAHTGNKEKTIETATWLVDHLQMNMDAGAHRAWWPNVYQACALAILGRDDEALTALQRIKQSPGLVWYPLLVDSPCLQRYADDERYVDVVNNIEERMLDLQNEIHGSF